MVVERAQEHSVGEVCPAALAPGAGGVMGLAPSGGDLAALGSAPAVADSERLSLRRREQPTGAPEVEHLTTATEDRRHDLGGAGQAARLGRGDPAARRELRDTETAAQGLEIE